MSGLGLIWTAVDAIEYFRRQRQIAGGSWILTIFIRASGLVTMGASIITAVRMITLTTGAQAFLSVLVGLVIIALLLIPKGMQIVFQQHEGR
jgi:hypothetical protein